MISIAQPDIGEEEISAVSEVMQTGMLASGEIVKQFECEFANYLNGGDLNAVATNSGTSALHTALLGHGIRSGDEVIIPSFTFIATATSVSMCGARPVMADVNEETFTLDPVSVSEKISENTKAVIGVHLFGQACEIDALSSICDDHGLIFIEDCAQAHGAEYKGKKVGTFGDAACFSFYPTKNMTTGEGGMITAYDKTKAQKFRRIINHGQDSKYLHTELGYNYRLTNIGAAIGRVQLGKLDAMNKRRKENAEFYNRNLKKPWIITPVVGINSDHVYHQYVVKTDETEIKRDQLAEILRENHIGTAVHYPIPVHKQPLYADSVNYDCPVSECLSESVLSLPVHPGITEKNCEYVCEVINGVF